VRIPIKSDTRPATSGLSRSWVSQLPAAAPEGRRRHPGRVRYPPHQDRWVYWLVVKAAQDVFGPVRRACGASPL
jgi:hypothetical protein